MPTRKKTAAGRQSRTLHVNELAHQLLRLVLAANRTSRFQLRDIAPTTPTKYLAALEMLLEGEYVERVTVQVGQWYYRVTQAGRMAAKSDEVPVVRKPWVDEPEREPGDVKRAKRPPVYPASRRLLEREKEKLKRAKAEQARVHRSGDTS